MDSQQPRNFRSSSQAVGLALLLFPVLSLLFIPMPSHTFLWKAVNNFAHVPLFGLVAIGLLHLSRLVFAKLRWPPIRYYMVAIIGALAIASLTEMLQSFTATRQAEVSDIVQDFVGAICGLGMFFTYDPRAPAKWAHWRQFPRHAIIRLCVIVVLGITLVPIVGWAYAYWDRAGRFPSIVQFSSDSEMKFVTALDSELQVVVPPEGWKKSTEDTVGQVVFHTQKYPGIRLDEPYPDWNGYSHFQLDIFSELSTPQSIGIRIDDNYGKYRYTDVFNKTLTIFPGLNQIRIPLEEIRLGPVGREMDLSAIQAVWLFARNPPEEFMLYLDNIHLE